MALREQHEANEKMELVELDFNNYALVKLTEHWKKIYDQFFLSRRLNPNDYPIKTTEDWFAKIQLWELMEIFWSAMYNWNPNSPFEDMNFKMEMEKKVTSGKKESDFWKRVLDVIE